MDKNQNSSGHLAKVTVCASCGNIGPGFDVAGLAMDLYNQYTVYPGTGKNYELEFTGQFSREVPPYSEENLIIRAVKKVLQRYGDRIDAGALPSKKLKEIPLIIKGDINLPLKSGLGSSASAVVAGLLIANKVYSLNLTKKELFNLGLEIENHADNIAAAISGGLAVVYEDKNEYKFEKITFKKDYKILLMIPDFGLDTMKAREAVPENIPLKDCTKNVSNFFLLVKSLQEGDLKQASIFIKDHIHQQYRRSLYPGSMELMEELNEKYEIPSAISGAGPSVMAIMDDEKFEEYKKYRGVISGKYLSYRTLITRISNKGSHYF